MRKWKHVSRKRLEWAFTHFSSLHNRVHRSSPALPKAWVLPCCTVRSTFQAVCKNIYAANFKLTSNYILSSKGKLGTKQPHQKKTYSPQLTTEAKERDSTKITPWVSVLMSNNFKFDLTFISQSTYSKIAKESLHPYVVLQKEKILLFVFLVQTL